MERGKSLVCSFKKDCQINDVKVNEKMPLYSNHVYAIVGINEANEYVRIIEPNKAVGRKSKKSGEGGHIAVNFKDFKDNYERVYYVNYI